MTTITPSSAAQISLDIYALENANGKNRDLLLSNYKSDFHIKNGNNASNTPLNGTTGVIIKNHHLLGFAAAGKKNGQYSDQAVIAIKGTNSLADALTDLNTGVKISESGGFVHQGFLNAFNSLLPDLKQFISSLPQEIHTLHCIGHSLGGAIATLLADWLTLNTSKSIKLYTFGSPRVGLDFFTSGALRRIGSSNVYRVHHNADAVPMLPTWPFHHIPDGGNGDIQLKFNSINPLQQHSIQNYLYSTQRSNTPLTWEQLRVLRPQNLMDKSIEAWLKSDSPVSFSISTAQILSSAILYVVSKITELAGIALVMAAGTSFTLLDRLAIMMNKAAEFSKDLSIWVTRLIKRMAKLLGIVVVEGVSLTISFIRNLFIRMHHAISELVTKATRTL